MPCTKCRSDFNVFNWKLKCGECCDKYCNKCLNKKEGVLYCEKCMILLKRPPDPDKLMELKPKDLQDYLKKNNISTYGLVEKQELVALFCNKHIPVKPKRGAEKLTANFAGSVPNLRPQALLNDFLSNIESSIFTENQNVSGSNTRSFRAPPSSEPTTSTNSVDNLATRNQEIPKSSPAPRKYPRLSDYDNLEDLSSLSAKDLKIILTINRVDYKGCVEKSELLERVERLWSDKIKQKTEDLSQNVEDLCKLCMDAPLDCVLLDCGHIATCIDCGKKLAECPICRQYVVRVVRTFKA